MIGELLRKMKREEEIIEEAKRDSGAESRELLTWLSVFCRCGVPIRSAICLYEGCDRKNFLSAARAARMSFFPSMSF